MKFWSKSRKIFLHIIIFNEIGDRVFAKWLTGHVCVLKALSEAPMCTRTTGRLTSVTDLIVE